MNGGSAFGWKARLPDAAALESARNVRPSARRDGSHGCTRTLTSPPGGGIFYSRFAAALWIDSPDLQSVSSNAKM